MQRITPTIWCNRTADAAADFYVTTFPNAEVVATQAYPEEGLLDFQQEFAGQTILKDVNIGGVMLSLLNAGDNYTPNPSISFMVNTTAEEVERLFAAFSAEGQVLMELSPMPFSPLYGWVQDKFGVSWQLVAAGDHLEEELPYLVPCLMFAGSAAGQAEAAIDFYTSVLPDSNPGVQATFAELGQADAPADFLAFARFTLAGQYITAMDSPGPMEFGFDCGIALQFAAHGQQELDRVWAALSAHPEAERCGWLRDKFGVSWEIIPDNLGELMAQPGAYEKLMGMTKIVIDDFYV